MAPNVKVHSVLKVACRLFANARGSFGSLLEIRVLKRMMNEGFAGDNSQEGWFANLYYQWNCCGRFSYVKIEAQEMGLMPC